MTIDAQAAKNLALPSFRVDVERGRLRSFSRAIGETDPTYLDLDCARAAGHPDLPVPPTFFFSLGLEQDEPFGYLESLGVDMRHVLHGEQSFDYTAMAYAGDTLTLQDQITDVYAKKGGALEFLIKVTEIHRGDELIATSSTTVVVRNPESGI